jgi:hypothetical protein
VAAIQEDRPALGELHQRGQQSGGQRLIGDDQYLLILHVAPGKECNQ